MSSVAHELTWQEWVESIAVDQADVCAANLDDFQGFEWAAHLVNRREAQKTAFIFPIGANNLRLAAVCGSPRVFQVFASVSGGNSSFAAAIADCLEHAKATDEDTARRVELLTHCEPVEVAAALQSFLNRGPRREVVIRVALLLRAYGEGLDEDGLLEFGRELAIALAVLDDLQRDYDLSQIAGIFITDLISLISDEVLSIQVPALKLVLKYAPEQWVYAHRNLLIANALRLRSASSLAFLLGYTSIFESEHHMSFEFLLWVLRLSELIRSIASRRLQDEERTLFLPYSPQDLQVARGFISGDNDDEGALEDLLEVCARSEVISDFDDSAHGSKFAGVPLALPFVVLSVVAASRMESAEYHSKLEQLLGGRSIVPRLFVGWQEVAAWTATEWNLEVPIRNGFVNTATDHCLLREIDLRHLPRFFSQERLEPHALLLPTQIEGRFVRWGQNHLTPRGRDDLEDSVKVKLVLEQVCSQLEAWDGTTIDTEGRLVRPVFLRLGLIPESNSVRLSVAAVKPNGAPETLDLGTGVTLEAWDLHYEATYIDGNENASSWLTGGKSWEIGKYRVELPRRELRIFVPSQSLDSPLIGGAAWIESEFAPKHGRFLVACNSATLAVLSQSVNLQPKPLFSDWMVLGPTCLQNFQPVPSILSVEREETEQRLVFEGGIRLADRIWLLMEPPHVLPTGEQEAVFVNSVRSEFDGREYKWSAIREGRNVFTDEHGHTLASIWLDSGYVAPRVLLSERTEDEHRVYVLEKGTYTLLGNGGESLTHNVKRGAALVRCNFSPAWIYRHSPPAILAGDAWRAELVCDQVDDRAKWELCLVNASVLNPKKYFGRAGRRVLSERWTTFSMAAKEKLQC